MATEIKVPALGESVSSATVARWLKQPGEAVAQDEPVVELETDKVTLEVPAPVGGVLAEQRVGIGGEAGVGEVLGVLEAEAVRGSGVKPPRAPPGPVGRPASPTISAPPPATPNPMPAAAKLIAGNNLEAEAIGLGSAKGGRLAKGDVLAFLSRPQAEPPAAPQRLREAGEPAREERVRMTRLRRTLAARLKEAQNTAAMLTTFNEVDMSAVMALRALYREAFEKKHPGARLGFMSFFVKAAVAALAEFPAVNAGIDGEDIVYKHYVHMGIAVGGPAGLVVPVLRDADRLNCAEIEKRIADFGRRAREGTLKLEELASGTFTITNGGVYGSLLSTPILNPPQSAILGMHKIEERPVAIAGKVEIRPMMYVALTYDHRLVDGREAVSFLVRVKEGVEDPRRLLLDL